MNETETRVINGVHVVASSGCHRYGYWNEQAIFDGRKDTGWCTPSRSVWQNEFLEIALPGVFEVSRIRMLSRVINKDAGFPTSFRLSRKENGQMVPLLFEDNIVNTVDTWHEWSMKKATARILRVDFLSVNWRPEKKYFLQIMGLEIYGNKEHPAQKA